MAPGETLGRWWSAKNDNGYVWIPFFFTSIESTLLLDAIHTLDGLVSLFGARHYYCIVYIDEIFITSGFGDSEKRWTHRSYWELEKIQLLHKEYLLQHTESVEVEIMVLVCSSALFIIIMPTTSIVVSTVPALQT